jgi:nucleotide-binding universal stress UspA family protein
MSTFSIRKILVPVDMSETSFNALETAVSIARRHGASIIILNVLEITPDAFLSERSFSLHKHDLHSADILSALAGAILHSNELEPVIVQEEGNVADTVIRTSIIQHADLVVMGSHGASGYRNNYIGSNAYNVIKQSLCPVMIVPPKKKYTSFQKVVFPVRPVTHALARFDVVSHFLQPAAQLDVLGLSYRKLERETAVLDKVVDEVREQLHQLDVRPIAVWGSGDSIADDVLEYTQHAGPDLLVITSVLDIINKPNFVGPHTQKIIHCARVPVLSIKRISVPILA